MKTARILSWPRRNALALSIAAGTLTDDGIAIVDNGVVPVLSARAYADDGNTTPTPITGADTVPLTWSASRASWRGALPHISAFLSLSSVRVIVTLVDGATSYDLMDAVAKFGPADGR